MKKAFVMAALTVLGSSALAGEVTLPTHPPRPTPAPRGTSTVEVKASDEAAPREAEKPAEPLILLPESELFEKATSQGVPAEALHDVQDFLRGQMNRDFVQDTYVCKGKDETSVKPCPEDERTPSKKTVTLKPHPYAVIIDYGKPSTEERLFLIDLRNGNVEKMLATHGKGSGNGNYAYKFSNTKDSRQTSLGIYLLGEVYSGSYGPTLRMYGLEKSNDQAYNRDIVMHGAWYADRSFIKKQNHETKKPYGRLGVSWGCPAVALANQKRLVPLLKEGALIYHYHAELQRESRLGGPVQMALPPAEYLPVPLPRPEPPPSADEKPKGEAELAASENPKAIETP